MHLGTEPEEAEVEECKDIIFGQPHSKTKEHNGKNILSRQDGRHGDVRIFVEVDQFGEWCCISDQKHAQSFTLDVNFDPIGVLQQKIQETESLLYTQSESKNDHDSKLDNWKNKNYSIFAFVVPNPKRDSYNYKDFMMEKRISHSPNAEIVSLWKQCFGHDKYGKQFDGIRDYVRVSEKENYISVSCNKDRISRKFIKSLWSMIGNIGGNKLRDDIIKQCVKDIRIGLNEKFCIHNNQNGGDKLTMTVKNSDEQCIEPQENKIIDEKDEALTPDKCNYKYGYKYLQHLKKNVEILQCDENKVEFKLILDLDYNVYGKDSEKQKEIIEEVSSVLGIDSDLMQVKICQGSVQVQVVAAGLGAVALCYVIVNTHTYYVHRWLGNNTPNANFRFAIDEQIQVRYKHDRYDATVKEIIIRSNHNWAKNEIKVEYNNDPFIFSKRNVEWLKFNDARIRNNNNNNNNNINNNNNNNYNGSYQVDEAIRVHCKCQYYDATIEEITLKANGVAAKNTIKVRYTGNTFWYNTEILVFDDPRIKIEHSPIVNSRVRVVWGNGITRVGG